MMRSRARARPVAHFCERYGAHMRAPERNDLAHFCPTFARIWGAYAN